LPQRVMKLRIKTQNKRQVIDITKEVQTKLGNVSGLANIFVLHTTAAITTADLDPGTDATIEGIKSKENYESTRRPK
jgi:thiamine phosphate synthase YjbQ (UPF0047 family)